MNEADTRANYTDPQLRKSSWKPEHIIREYQFTDGQKIGGGQRGKQLIADYLLKYKGESLAIVEAKALSLHPTTGLEQVKNYANKLNLEFAYCTNGEKIYEFSMATGKGAYIEAYPTPEELYLRINPTKNEEREEVVQTPYHIAGEMKPRYYQELAINKSIQAITEGKDKILLTLATGTGKTFIAFQLVYKLFNARWNRAGKKRRPKVLFLADRNVLADQAINTFNPMEKELVKIDGSEIRKRNGKVPTNYSIYFAIYQAISDKEDIGGYYSHYPKDFFDLIIIDECHRGSANEEGSWRKILDYFNGAIHLGLTATPKRDDNVDTYNYFGKPIYEYSLKEGIEDGFLSPYKVKRIKTNIDEYIYTSDDKVEKGEVDKRKVYRVKNFNREIVIPKRQELIAKAILQNINPLDKTIVFCVDQPHAASLRDYINKHKTVNDPNYCVRVTSDEKEVGRTHLENFQNNDKDIPAILTSSQMLTTGVDAKNVRNIVLVKTIGSIVEFKQIVGRGTRVFEGKEFFTILDFTGATELFYDERWDGMPDERPIVIQIDDDGQQTGEIEQKEKEDYEQPPPAPPVRDRGRKPKLTINLSTGRQLRITDVETRYIGADGKPQTATQFLESLIGFLPQLYKDEAHLREIWKKPETRKALLGELRKQNIGDEQLEIMRRMFEASNSDIFDVLNHISHNQQIVTRTQRASKVKENKSFFDVYTDLKAKDFLNFVLERYEQDGIRELDRDKLGELIKLNDGLGTAVEAAKVFGGREELLGAFYELQEQLYRAS